MFRRKYSKYISLGITLLLVVIASVIFVVIFTNLQGFFSVISAFFRVASFLVFGALFAYLINPILKLVEKPITKLLGKTNMTERKAKRLSRSIGIVIAMIVFLLILAMIFVLLVPQIVVSVQDLITPENLNRYYDQIIRWADNVTHGTALEGVIAEQAPQWLTQVQDWLTTEVLGNLVTYLTTIFSEVYNVAYSIFLGLVVAIYFLFSKENFQAQAKKLVVSMLKPKHADRVLEISRRTNNVFGGYIIGKITEALLVGVLSYIVFLILGIPYQTLLAVIQGVGVLVPIFGPLIAAALGILLVLLLSPAHTLYFLIAVIALMLIDGNIIGPKILGDRLGLSNFWVVVMIALFSGLFGLTGLLIGLPIFAIVYSLTREAVENSLRKKGKPVTTDVYYSILAVSDLNKYRKDFGEPTVFFSEDTFDTEYDPDEDFEYFDPDE